MESVLGLGAAHSSPERQRFPEPLWSARLPVGRRPLTYEAARRQTPKGA
ncbi:hypothetical protein ABZX12_41235 [Kribbella sp. NPDC003505]